MSEGNHSKPEAVQSTGSADPSSAESERSLSADAVGNTRRSDESDPKRRRPGRGKRIIKWAVVIIGLLFFLSVLREAMDPFGDKPYLEISHGDHVHYVPSDRDPNVPMGRFPTTEPASDERITPDGRIVKKDGRASDRPPQNLDDQAQ